MTSSTAITHPPLSPLSSAEHDRGFQPVAKAHWGPDVDGLIDDGSSDHLRPSWMEGLGSGDVSDALSPTSLAGGCHEEQLLKGAACKGGTKDNSGMDEEEQGTAVQHSNFPRGVTILDGPSGDSQSTNKQGQQKARTGLACAFVLSSKLIASFRGVVTAIILAVFVVFLRGVLSGRTTLHPCLLLLQTFIC